jgi:hypothetical protein
VKGRGSTIKDELLYKDIERMEGSVIKIGMMQREKKKEWFYSKESMAGSEWSRYRCEISWDKWESKPLCRYIV